MDWNRDSLTQDKLHEYRRAAEAAWSDDTRHEGYVGHPQPSAGQCYVTSRWLTTHLGGHVGSKDGHYFWVSPDRKYVVDLTGDQFAYAPAHPAVEGMQLDAEDEPWSFDEDHKRYRPGPIMFKRADHPLYKGFRVKAFKTETPRVKLFNERANQALASPQPEDGAGDRPLSRTADFGWGGDSHPGQEPQVVERYEHDRPSGADEHYKWVYANGRLELSPEDDYNALADFTGIHRGDRRPVALGEVNVRGGRAEWKISGNLGLAGLARVLHHHTRVTGWEWGGLKDMSDGQKVASRMWWMEDRGHLVLMTNRPGLYDGVIDIIGKTAHVQGAIDPVREALQEWADDHKLALNTGIKTREDIDGYDTYGPRPEYAQGPTDSTPPTGTLRCPECGVLFPSFGQYILHRKEEEPKGENLDEVEDGHFPEMDMDKAIPPHFHEREPFVFPLARTAAKLDRHMDKVWDTEREVHLGAYLNGDLVGMSSINHDSLCMVTTAVRAPEVVYTRLVQAAQQRFDVLDVANATPAEQIWLARLNFVDLGEGYMKWSKGKEPMDMIPDPIPFIFDVNKDEIHVGQPGASTHSLMLPEPQNPDEPKGIVEGVYEPGGVVTITGRTDIPWTVRHLVDLWYWSHPHMRVTDVQYKDPTGEIQKLTKSVAEVGPYVRQLAAMDPAVWKAYQALEAAGGEVYAVGGVVRDALMDVPSNDIDLMVRGLHQDQVNEILKKLPGSVDLTGKSFGVYRYNYKGHEVEIALPRTESSTGDRRVDFDVNVDHTLPVEKDLERRDFTGNSVAVSMKDGSLVDPFGGADDIKNGVLRTTHPNSFKEDPTRTLRALVMHGRYGWEPDERTRAELEQYAGRIHNESWDNMNGIMDKIMKSKNPAAAMRLAHETGVLKHILPELDSSWDYDSRNPHHAYPLGTHHMHVLEGMAEQTDDPDLRMAALLHDIGKPASRAMKCIDCNHVWHESDNPSDPFRCPACGSENTKGTFHGGDGVGHDHAPVGAAMAEERLTHMKYPVARRKRIVDIIRHHMFSEFSSPKGARKFMNRVGDHADDLLTFRQADMFGKGVPQDAKQPVDNMRALVEQARQTAAPTNLSGLAINGRDVMTALGLAKPGPIIGQVLNSLMQAVIEDPALNNRESLIAMVQQNVQNAQA